MDVRKFVQGVERLVDPITVGTLQFLQSFNSLLPKDIQNYIVTSSAKQTPFMGFVVEPYATFLCYEIKDLDWAKKLLPVGFDLIKTKIFAEDEPKYYCIFGNFTAHTSAFWGSRVEFYIIAVDKQTNLLTWIIVDYDSNTISFDLRDGLKSPNASGAITTSYEGKVYAEFKRKDNSRGVKFSANLEKATMRDLDQRLWLEGNLSIGYGSEFDPKDAHIFSLRFNPGEVEKGLDIPLDEAVVEHNSWYPGLFSTQPSKVLSFPYAQHFVSDSPGAASKIMDRAELVKSIEALDLEKVKVFSTDSFKKMFLVGSILSALLTLSLIVLLIIK